ncbi:amidohydrolase family protein [Candidatus Cyrtobacter comes]|uniref:hypothetical protein n=1 Tax=Candidatus Cyrtobacter comes TaxID=675776 RepID=UPI002ACE421A|nr:hypothetical protein [Candidatus Cyrtobacter comes]
MGAIQELPLVDIHVHLPGTISPRTAWDLGVRNGFISIDNEHGGVSWRNGPNSLQLNAPFEHYSNIFKQPIILDNGPVNLEYNIDYQSFKSFDHIMATVQGHRHPPGGIQNESDLEFVLKRYMHDCIEQKVFYTELQQNIRIAYTIYSGLDTQEARLKLYSFLKRQIIEFAKHDIILRFIHCFNKTQASLSDSTTYNRAVEASEWLKEAHDAQPGVFVGIESAGHEKDESGWPAHLKAGYEAVRDIGLGCEAHGGEATGVEHMMDVIRMLPITRLAHGFQVIEDEKSIFEVMDRDVTLVMAPLINMKLGACLHTIADKDGHLIPKSKSHGGVKSYIDELYQHPFFKLIREYKGIKIALSSDNPYMAGRLIKESIIALAGLSSEYIFPDGTEPLRSDELVQCCLSGIDAAFCDDEIKQMYKSKLSDWIKKYRY